MNRFTLLLFDIIKKRKTSFFLKKFQRVKNLSGEEIKKYQFVKLKNLLIHAEKNVPFYRKRFRDNKFSPKAFSTLGQIAEIPPLTRKDLQTHWKEIVALNFDLNHLNKGSSSGSSGLPVIYYKDTMASSAGQAANILGWTFSGWKMDMKGLHIWGNPSTVKNEWEKPGSKIKAFIFGHHKFPAYQLVDPLMFYKLYDEIVNNRYQFLDGYTNAIYLFADFLKQKKLKLPDSVKYVLTTAENLQRFQRQTIEETIGPVYDTYGCSEINGIAYECEFCKNYHIIDPHVYVEFGERLDDSGTCELMITDLDNFGFPLIRYQNDDLGVPVNAGAKDCPVKFSRIAGITGRQSDIIRLKDGGTLSVPSFFGSMLLKQINGLVQYQIEKLEDDLIIVNLVKTSEFSSGDEDVLSKALSDYLAGRISYQINYVDRIDPSDSGKIKLVVDRTKNK